MKPVPGSSHGKQGGGCAASVIIALSMVFLLAFLLPLLLPPRNTPNLISLLGSLASLAGVCIGLLQIPFVLEWFLKTAKRIDAHAGKVAKKLERAGMKAWKFHSIILVFILLGFILETSFPVSDTFSHLLAQACVQGQAPSFVCGNGISTTLVQVDEGRGGQHITSVIKIGMIDSQNAGPFNQYDTVKDERQEQKLEQLIFTENQLCNHPSSGTLIIATTLSQSVVDSGLSSSVGLDNLRGAYLAQYNFNRAQQQFCLHLLIANFGTKGVSLQTVPVVMQQIRLYAQSNPNTFMGVVGFPFSVSVQAALYARLHISSDALPILSPSAAADTFTSDPSAPPANLYTNFYRMVAPVTVEGQVLADFLQNGSRGILTPTNKITVLFEDSNDPYSSSLSNAISGSLGGGADIRVARYHIGQPDSLNEGIDLVKNSQCPPGQQCKAVQIFFAGYADDLNILKNKLHTAREQGILAQPIIRLIGGEGFYDLGSYNIGNYADLFFTMDASSDQVNPFFLASAIPAQYRQCPGSQPPFNCEFSHLFAQVYPSDIYGSELAGMHALLTYDAVQAFIEALKLAEGETAPALWQAISHHWSDVKFEGVSGKIQFPALQKDTAPHPINKSIYVACTDSRGFTYIVAAYLNTEQAPLSPTTYTDHLQACLQNA